MIRLMVVDDNIEIINSIKVYFKESDIHIAYEAYDGEEAINTILKHDDFDILLLDLVMPKKDGLYVLNEMKNHHIKKDVIVATSLSVPELIKEVSDLGAKYYVLKPYDIEDLKRRIYSIYNKNISKDNLDIRISSLLHKLGIPSHFNGYKYIKDGVTLIYECGYHGKIVKEIYEKLANKYNTTVSRVERTIRHAVERCWNQADLNMLEDIFGNTISFNKNKPSNREFIITIAELLKLHN